MSVDWSRTALLLDPDDPQRFGIDPDLFRERGIQVVEAPYEGIGRDGELHSRLAGLDIDAVLFTRNDEMRGKPRIGNLLAARRKGYTAISGIDGDREEEQTRLCIEDFLGHGGPIDLPDITAAQTEYLPGRPRFSVIFDFEQLGGARFGIPRLLPELERRGIRATFFVTGIIAELYPTILERLHTGGHEIGIHGAVHEFLSGRSPAEQADRIRGHKNTVERFEPIRGANYIFRMDAATPRALKDAGLEYFVLFRKHTFYRSRFMDASCRVRNVRTNSGDIAMIPVPVETYSGDEAAIKAMIDSALRTIRREKGGVLSVLMHPFKDGMERRMPLTVRILDYLCEDLRLTPVPLAESGPPEPAPANAVRVAYRWHGFEPKIDETRSNGVITRLWWPPIMYQAQRAERLADGFAECGGAAVLVPAESTPQPNVEIFPDAPVTDGAEAACDPLTEPAEAATAVLYALNERDLVRVIPPGSLRNLWNFLKFHFPRTGRDFKFLMRRLLDRISGR